MSRRRQGGLQNGRLGPSEGAKISIEYDCLRGGDLPVSLGI